MKKFIFYSTTIVLLAMAFACSRNELDLDKFSGLVEVDQVIAVPLINGDVTTSDIFNLLEANPLVVDNDTVKLIFSFDSISFIEDDGTSMIDTFEIREEADTAEKAYVLDYGEMHYTFHNEFPVGVSCKLLLYDDFTQTVLDTISFNPGGSKFIQPAPVDADGLVITDEVVTYSDSVIIGKSTLDNLTMYATHIILSVVTELEEPGSVNSVSIPAENTVHYHFGLYGKGSYTTNLNSDN